MTIAAGIELAVNAVDWRDSIVVVERGSLEVEGLDGNRTTFTTGAMLCLDGLPTGTLCNRGPDPVQLFALSRASAPLESSTEVDIDDRSRPSDRPSRVPEAHPA
jgi:hypothetical protein